MRRIAASTLLLLVALTVGACGRKPAQDYAVAGKVRFVPGSSLDLRRVAEGEIELELVMTARGTPSIDDVVSQRRWANVGFTHTYGLGKGRGSSIGRKDRNLYVTAMINAYEARTKRHVGTWVGWTSEPVAVGRYDVEVVVDHRFGDSDYAAPGHPQGGWFSPSVLEESPPPGEEVADPGPRVFSGTLDVDAQDAKLRQTLSIFPVFLVARAKKDQGAPALVVRYELPIYPLRFSLHQFHRVDGTRDPIVDPLYIVAILDVDGNVGTKDDQVQVSTETAVEPGTADIRLTLDIEAFRRILQARMNELQGPPPAAGPAIASGRLEIEGEAPAGGSLWLTARRGDVVLFTQPLPGGGAFPREFALRLPEGTASVEPPFRISATLAASGEGGRVWRAISDEVTESGATGIVLTLRPE